MIIKDNLHHAINEITATLPEQEWRVIEFTVKKIDSGVIFAAGGVFGPHVLLPRQTPDEEGG